MILVQADPTIQDLDYLHFLLRLDQLA